MTTTPDTDPIEEPTVIEDGPAYLDDPTPGALRAILKTQTNIVLAVAVAVLVEYPDVDMPVDPTVVAEMINRTPASVTAALARLEDLGWVHRTAGLNDAGRAVIVYRTDDLNLAAKIVDAG